MWAAIKEETGGRVETEVFPKDGKNPGSDPAVLKLLVSGEVEFFTMVEEDARSQGVGSARSGSRKAGVKP